MTETMTTQNFTNESIGYLTQDMSMLIHSMIERINELESLTKRRESRLNPIRFDGQTLRIEGVAIPLQSRPLTCRLLHVFFQSHDTSLTRLEILQRVYGLSEEASSRKRHSTIVSLNKLICRTRRFIEQSLEGSPCSLRYSWLTFDQKTNRWQLYVERVMEVAKRA